MNDAVQKENKQNPNNLNQVLSDLLVSVILPTLILKYLSTEDKLGPVYALIFALSLPLSQGIYHMLIHKKFGFIPILGFISILLTGSIGILELDPSYIAIKEASIPGLIAIGTLISLKTRYPLVRTFIYNDTLLQTDKVHEALEKNNAVKLFDDALTKATYMLAGSFVVSSILNYALAKYIVTSPAGTPEFNDQLGTMNLLSFPVISVPSMTILFFALFYVFKKIKALTGLELEEIVHQ